MSTRPRYTFFLPPLQQTGHPGTSTPYRDKSELQNYVPPRRFRYASSHRFRTPPHTHVLSRRGANHAVAPKSAVAEPACRQYRVVRWFLLPEAGLRRRPLSPTTFVILTNRKCQLYPGCTPRQASCYGRCFARSVAPDAALRLVRRKRGTSLPHPQSASDFSTQLAVPSGLNCVCRAVFRRGG